MISSQIDKCQLFTLRPGGTLIVPLPAEQSGQHQILFSSRRASGATSRPCFRMPGDIFVGGGRLIHFPSARDVCEPAVEIIRGIVPARFRPDACARSACCRSALELKINAYCHPESTGSIVESPALVRRVSVARSLDGVDVEVAALSYESERASIRDHPCPIDGELFVDPWACRLRSALDKPGESGVLLRLIADGWKRASIGRDIVVIMQRLAKRRNDGCRLVAGHGQPQNVAIAVE